MPGIFENWKGGWHDWSEVIERRGRRGQRSKRETRICKALWVTVRNLAVTLRKAFKSFEQS